MNLGKKIMVIIGIWIPVAAFSQATFSADSVYDHIRFLAEEIGPRPMGSAAERRALDWVAEKFRSYGADSAYVMRFDRVDGKPFRINTNSGIAVGLFRGDSDTTIAVGGHADSSPPESPGANDNASGTATAIELARLWSQRPRHYTMLFLSFGGEEMGLYGSQYFVDHYPEIDLIGLMFSADMTGGPGEIVTIMENKEGQAPRWLLRDAFRINREMGLNSLLYPTRFAAVNSLAEAAGSDHEPFLKAHIPAMDFTTGLNYTPIHGAMDNLANIDTAQLDQCGRFIDALLSHYQTERLPEKKLDHYTLWNLAGHLFFIPQWILITLVLVSLLLGARAFLQSRQGRRLIPKTERSRFSGLKLAGLFLLVAIVSQGGEGLIQLIKGLRYPWLMHVRAYLLLMIIWAVGGLWLALRISRRWRWNPEPHMYAGRTLIILAVYTLAAWFGSARLAIYPGLSLLFFSLAVLARPEVVKACFALVAPLPMLRLAFSELTVFMARNLSETGLMLDSFFKASLYSAALTLLLLLLFLPFIYSSAYIIVQVPVFRRGLKSLPKPAPGVAVVLIVLLSTMLALSLPAYDQGWRPFARLQADYTGAHEDAKLTLAGNEYFQDLQVQSDSLDLRFSGRTHKEELALDFGADWIRIDGSTQRRDGEQDSVEVDWILRSTEPWHAVTLTLRADTLEIGDADANYKFRLNEDNLSFTWRADPLESLRLHARFVVHPRARLIREVTASYLMPPIPIKIISQFHTIGYRTKITLKDTLEMRKE